MIKVNPRARRHDDRAVAFRIPQASAQHPYRVPAGEFYMLGDNRSDSCDSRFWGPVQGSTMVGKVLLTWWHASHPVFRWY